jgi:hypothetical protein
MCKELPVIPFNKVVDPKRIIQKMEGRGGGGAQGVADQKNPTKQTKTNGISSNTFLYEAKQAFPIIFILPIVL